MKKILIVLISLFIVVNSFIFSQEKSKQDYWLDAVTEKKLEVKLTKLEDYLNRYGEKDKNKLPTLYLLLARTSFNLKKYDKTIEYGEKALTFKENDFHKLELFLKLANAYYLREEKDTDKAYHYAGLVVDLAKSMKGDKIENANSQTKINLDLAYIRPALITQIKVLYSTGKNDLKAMQEALKLAEEAFSIKADKVMAKNIFMISYMLYKLGDKESAINALSKITEKVPDQRFCKLLATWYSKIGKKDKALEVLKKSYEKRKSAKLAYNIGILLKKKNLDEALNYFAEAYVLNSSPYSEKAFKIMEFLFYNEKMKGVPQDKQDAAFKELIAAAKSRLNIE